MNPHHRELAWRARAVAALGVALALCSASGCYERVVGASGPGSDSINTYEPNLKTPSEKMKRSGSEQIPSERYTGDQ